jgi:hypothetical protein
MSYAAGVLALLLLLLLIYIGIGVNVFGGKLTNRARKADLVPGESCLLCVHTHIQPRKEG